MKPLFFAFVVMWSPSLISAQTTWPEFRGPNGDGQADNADLPVKIDESVIRWRTKIHGKGWSSPVVWDDQIWLTTATEDGKTMSALCIDRINGNVVHDKVMIENESPAFCIPMNSYASPTPAIEKNRIYVHFGSYLTACLDTSSAEVLWERRDLKCDHYRGPASSPILDDGRLYVAYDGFDVQYVIALDCNTGETVWKRSREIDYGTDNGDRMKAYGTAQIIQVDGQKQLICPSAVATIAYAPSSGKTLWTVYHDGMNASARPIYREGLLYLNNGMGSMVAVRPKGRKSDGHKDENAANSNITASNIAWSDHKLVSKRASLIVVDGLIYMNSDDGVLSCREAATGQIVWKHRAGGNFAASPVYADGRIYFFNMDGLIMTVKAGRDFKKLAETELGDGFMASPAVIGDELILRSKTELICVAKP